MSARALSRLCRRTTGLLSCGVLLASALPLRAAEVGQRFESVEAFVNSAPHGQATVPAGYADLAGAGRRDWAGVVGLEDPDLGDSRRIVVLTQQADGSYRVAAQGPVQSTFGGTGHHSLDNVTLKRGSVFVSWSWNWHGCGGGVIQQIKFHDNAWRVIGTEFRAYSEIETPDGYDDGDSATMSRNLLTGALVVHITPAKGKPKTTTYKLKPATVLLDDDFGEETGTAQDFVQYGGC